MTNIFCENYQVSSQVVPWKKQKHPGPYGLRCSYWCGQWDLNPYGLPHAPQTCASASSATLAYSVRAALRTSEVGSRLCGLLEYSTTFAGNRQAFFGFFIDFFGVHILIEPTKIQKQHAREVLACVCLYHVCGGCFWGRGSLRV